MSYIMVDVVLFLHIFMLNFSDMKCELCNYDYQLSPQSFYRLHLKNQHGITSKQYYDIFIKKQGEGICLCGKETKYKNFDEGYCVSCSKKCSTSNKERNDKIKSTKRIRYGDENYNNREQSLKTTLDRYNVTNVSKLDNIKLKKINKCIKNYGVKNPLQNKSIYNKILKTKKEKYEDENYNNRNKAKETMTNKYGFDSYSKTPEYRKYLEDNGLCIPNNKLSAFQKYYRKVWNITKRNKKELFKKWNGKCYYTKDELNPNCHYNDKLYPVIDHKISLFYGFKKSISEEIIGSIDNLCICSRECNQKKNKLTEKQFKKLLCRM